jgi:hypothetical protein
MEEIVVNKIRKPFGFEEMAGQYILRNLPQIVGVLALR